MPCSGFLGARRGGCLHLCYPSQKKKGAPTTVAPSLPPAHGEDVDSLLLGLSLLEDFGFSSMNLLRRSVSELAWAPAYASPEEEAEDGLMSGGMLQGSRSSWEGARDTHQCSWRARPCSGSQ